MNQFYLSYMIATPLIGAFIIILLPKKEEVIKGFSVFVSFVTLLLSIVILLEYDAASYQMQFVEKRAWISTFNIDYHLGIDGISLPFVLLVSVISFFGIIASWRVARGIKGYFFLYLLLESGLLGVFCAIDFFLFFLFWNIILIPLYFLASIWGEKNSESSSMRFLIVSIVGSLVMLLVMLALYYNYDPHTFNLLQLSGGKFNDLTLSIFGNALPLDKILFFGLLLTFAIRLPVWPFHTWLVEILVESPSVISVVISAIFIKLGGYGIIRILYPLFPDISIWFTQALIVFGIVNILYGAFCALAQNDLKKMLAYYCISTMGFFLLGMASFNLAGTQGAVFYLLVHGIVVAVMFFMIGVLYERVRSRNIVDADNKPVFGGLIRMVPVYSGLMTIAVFSAIALPGFATFIGQILIFLGSFEKHGILPVFGAFGMLLLFVCFLMMYRKVFLGEYSKKEQIIMDVSAREKLFVIPLVVILIVFGVYPAPLMKIMEATMKHLLVIVGV